MKPHITLPRMILRVLQLILMIALIRAALLNQRGEANRGYRLNFEYRVF